MIEYTRLAPTQEELDRLLELSSEWEAEDSCRGYRANTPDDLKWRTVYAAIENGQIVGYLFGLIEKAERTSTVIEAYTPYYEVEELYVQPDLRSHGVGRALFHFMEQDVKRDVSVIMLSTATKNARAILHFYLDEVGMEFWNARLFKYL